MFGKPIKIEADIQASIEKVWDSWTKPEHIQDWNFAGDDWHCPHAENDLRKDGRFSYTMAARDGSFQFNFSGTYLECVLHNKIKFQLDDDRIVVVEFNESNGITRVTETFDPENQNDPELQRKGWQMILDRFKGYVEQG